MPDVRVASHEKLELAVGQLPRFMLAADFSKDQACVEQMMDRIVGFGDEAVKTQTAVKLGIRDIAAAQGGHRHGEFVGGHRRVGQNDLAQGNRAAGVRDACQFREQPVHVLVRHIVERRIAKHQIGFAVADRAHIQPVADQDGFPSAILDRLASGGRLEHGRIAVDPHHLAAGVERHVGQLGSRAENDGAASGTLRGHMVDDAFAHHGENLFLRCEMRTLARGNDVPCDPGPDLGLLHGSSP